MTTGPSVSPAPAVRAAIAALLGLGLAACSVPGEARQGAKLMAAYTNGVKAELQGFAKARTDLAQARQRNVNQLERSAVETEQRNQREIFLWSFEKSSVGRDREKLYGGILAGAATALENRDALRALREEHDDKVAKAKTRVDTRSAELAKAAKALAQLGEEPSFKDRMKFYLCFFESVQKSIEDSQEAAEEELEAGEEAARAKEGEIGIPEIPEEDEDGADDEDEDDDGDDERGDDDPAPSAC